MWPETKESLAVTDRCVNSAENWLVETQLSIPSLAFTAEYVIFFSLEYNRI